MFQRKVRTRAIDKKVYRFLQYKENIKVKDSFPNGGDIVQQSHLREILVLT